MGRKNLQALVLILLVCLSACKKDKPDPAPQQPIDTTTNKVYIACEGLFGSGNAALSVYDVEKDVAYEDVFSTSNSTKVGDVLQSMAIVGDTIFLAINNSNKLIAISATDYKVLAQMQVSSPRYILPLGNGKAYVSSLYSRAIFIVDLKSMKQIGAIEMPKENTEGMLLHNGKVYACAWDTSNKSLFEIDPSTNAVTKQIPLAGYAPQEVLADKHGMLWVLSGNVQKGKSSALTCINPADGSIVKSFSFPAKADAIRPVFNKAKDILYFIEVNYNGGTEYNGIYKMDITSSELPAQPFIPAAQFQYFWALGIDPVTDYIYVGDPKGFIQKGSVYVYDKSGNKLKQFDVGVGPGHFYFD
jgi:outer membrane protein assembly factor BamB